LLNEEKKKPAPPTAADAPADSGMNNVEPVDPNDLPAVWQAALRLLAAHGPVLSSLLTPGQLVAIEDGRALIRYGPQHDTFVKLLERNGKKDLVREKLSQLLGKSVGVKFEVDPDAAAPPPAAPANPSPRASAHAPSRSTPAPQPSAPPPQQAPAVKLTPELIESLRNEPLVKALMDQMGAQIVKVE
jgi:hypothetical protein